MPAWIIPALVGCAVTAFAIWSIVELAQGNWQKVVMALIGVLALGMGIVTGNPFLIGFGSSGIMYGVMTPEDDVSWSDYFFQCMFGGVASSVGAWMAGHSTSIVAYFGKEGVTKFLITLAVQTALTSLTSVSMKLMMNIITKSITGKGNWYDGLGQAAITGAISGLFSSLASQGLSKFSDAQVNKYTGWTEAGPGRFAPDIINSLDKLRNSQIAMDIGLNVAAGSLSHIAGQAITEGKVDWKQMLAGAAVSAAVSIGFAGKRYFSRNEKDATPYAGGEEADGHGHEGECADGHGHGNAQEAADGSERNLKGFSKRDGDRLLQELVEDAQTVVSNRKNELIQQQLEDLQQKVDVLETKKEHANAKNTAKFQSKIDEHQAQIDNV
jgi:hypothetical protein